MTTRLTALAATAVLVTGCSATPDIGRTAPSAPVTQPSGAAPSNPNTATAQIDGMTVKASMPDGAAPSGETLTVAASPAEIPAAGAQVAAAQTARVRLGDDGAQPTKPIALTFDLSGKPELAEKFSDTVIPVVESASDTGDEAHDLLRATWDPATKSVTATTTHLSDFRLGAIDLGKVADGLASAYRALRGTTDSACKDKSEITVSGTRYTLTATNHGPVAGCLRESGGGVAVDFSNATQQFYRVTSEPRGTWSTTDWPTVNSVGGWFTSLLGNQKSSNLLAAKGTGRVAFSAGVKQAELTLRMDPAAIQAATIVTGLEMLTGMRPSKVGTTTQVPKSLELATSVTKVITCIQQGLEIGLTPGKAFSNDELRSTLSTSGGCVNDVREAVAEESKKQAISTVGTVLTLLGDLPDRLASGVTGALGELTGDDTLNFALTSVAPSTTTRPAAEGSTTIDRIEAFSWAYDKVGDDTYTIPRNGPATVYIQFKSYAGTKQVRGGCTSTITVTGGGTSKTKTTENCDSYDPGTYFELKNRGVYTFTIVVTQDGGGSFTATKTVTLR